MKNHPVNNEYVQNLQEGLLNEAKQTVYQSEDKAENKSFLTKDVKLDKFPIKKKKLTPAQKALDVDGDGDIEGDDLKNLRKKKVNEVRGNEQATKDRIAKAAGRMSRASQLNRSESRDGKSFLKKPEDVVQPRRADGRPAKTPEEIGAQRGRIHRMLNARDEYNSTEHTEHQKAFNAGRKEAEDKVQSESRKGAPGSAKARMQDADSEKRREKLQNHANETAARDGGAGVASDIAHGRDEADIRSYGGSRQMPKVRGQKGPKPFKNIAGRILKKKINEDYGKGYPKQGIKGGTPEAKAMAKKMKKKSVDENDNNSYSGLSDNQGNPVRIGGNSSGVKGKNKLKLKLENAQAGYPERGIEGGTAEAKAYENRVAMKRKYKKKVEDKTRERLAK